MNSETDSINIRSKPTKVPEIPKRDDESDFIMPPSTESINEDLKAAVVQMESIETVPPNKFKVKDPPPRSPAPLPEAVSPAGVPIDMNSPELKGDIQSDTKSTRSGTSEKTSGNNERYNDFKIDMSALNEMDMTVEGKKSDEYKRNVRGSLVIIALLLLSIHLFLNHMTMFTWVVNFDSPQLVIAAVLYFISTMLVIVMLLAVLTVPALSTKTEKFGAYYSPILVAGGIDFIAVIMGGGIFSPLSIYTLDSMNFVFYNQIAVITTLLINGALYFAFTREKGKIYSMVHPFEKLQPEHEDEHEEEHVEE